MELNGKKVEQFVHTTNPNNNSSFEIVAHSEGFDPKSADDSFAYRYIHRISQIFSKQLDDEELVEFLNDKIDTEKSLREGAKPNIFTKKYKESDYKYTSVIKRHRVEVISSSTNGSLNENKNVDFRKEPEKAPYRIITSKLPDGRQFVVKATYIGKCYGNDPRNGNYVYNAFILPKDVELSPEQIIQLPFTSGLDKTDEKKPLELQSIDVENLPKVTAKVQKSKSGIVSEQVKAETKKPTTSKNGNSKPEVKEEVVKKEETKSQEDNNKVEPVNVNSETPVKTEEVPSSPKNTTVSDIQKNKSENKEIKVVNKTASFLIHNQVLNEEGKLQDDGNPQKISILNNAERNNTMFKFTSGGNVIAEVTGKDDTLNLKISESLSEQLKNTTKTGNEKIDSILDTIVNVKNIPIDHASIVDKQGNIHVTLDSGASITFGKEGVTIEDKENPNTNIFVPSENNIDITISRSALEKAFSGENANITVQNVDKNGNYHNLLSKPITNSQFLQNTALALAKTHPKDTPHVTNMGENQIATFPNPGGNPNTIILMKQKNTWHIYANIKDYKGHDNVSTGFFPIERIISEDNRIKIDTIKTNTHTGKGNLALTANLNPSTQTALSTFINKNGISFVNDGKGIDASETNTFDNKATGLQRQEQQKDEIVATEEKQKVIVEGNVKKDQNFNEQLNTSGKNRVTRASFLIHDKVIEKIDENGKPVYVDTKNPQKVAVYTPRAKNEMFKFSIKNSPIATVTENKETQKLSLNIPESFRQKFESLEKTGNPTIDGIVDKILNGESIEVDKASIVQTDGSLRVALNDGNSSIVFGRNGIKIEDKVANQSTTLDTDNTIDISISQTAAQRALSGDKSSNITTQIFKNGEYKDVTSNVVKSSPITMNMLLADATTLPEGQPIKLDAEGKNTAYRFANEGGEPKDIFMLVQDGKVSMYANIRDYNGHKQGANFFNLENVVISEDNKIKFDTVTGSSRANISITAGLTPECLKNVQNILDQNGVKYNTEKTLDSSKTNTFNNDTIGIVRKQKVEEVSSSGDDTGNEVVPPVNPTPVSAEGGENNNLTIDPTPVKDEKDNKSLQEPELPEPLDTPFDYNKKEPHKDLLKPTLGNRIVDSIKKTINANKNGIACVLAFGAVCCILACAIFPAASAFLSIATIGLFATAGFINEMNDIPIASPEKRAGKKLHRLMKKYVKNEKSKTKLVSKQKALKAAIDKIKNDQSYLRSQGKDVISQVSKLTKEYNELKAKDKLTKAERKRMNTLYKDIINLSYREEDRKTLLDLEKDYIDITKNIMDINSTNKHYLGFIQKNGHLDSLNELLSKKGLETVNTNGAPTIEKPSEATNSHVVTPEIIDEATNNATPVTPEVSNEAGSEINNGNINKDDSMITIDDNNNTKKNVNKQSEDNIKL